MPSMSPEARAENYAKLLFLKDKPKRILPYFCSGSTFLLIGKSTDPDIQGFYNPDQGIFGSVRIFEDTLYVFNNKQKGTRLIKNSVEALFRECNPLKARAFKKIVWA